MESSSVANIGITIVLIYSMIQMLTFYGIGINVYGSYLAFYAFLMLSTYILPTEYPQLT